MIRNIQVAAAVAAVLGSSAALAQQTAENPFAGLYISGSSAAKAGVFSRSGRHARRKSLPRGIQLLL